MRPPLAQGRMKVLPGNGYHYEFRRPWRDGTVATELSGPELTKRLVALIPAPRANLVRYHGTLAPNARLRASIVPQAVVTKGGKPRGSPPRWAVMTPRLGTVPHEARPSRSPPPSVRPRVLRSP